MKYIFEKNSVNVDKLEKEILDSSILAVLSYINHYDINLTVVFTSNLSTEEQSVLSTLVTTHTSTESTYDSIKNSVLIPARELGQQIINDSATENIMLGITQAGKTSIVRKALREVVDCLVTGSLYDAIAEIRAIPQESYDSTFITPVRMLKIINKIETYLKQPLSTEL